MQILVKKALDFLGLNMWHVVIGVATALLLAWFAWDNHNMSNKIESQAKEIAVVESDLRRSLEINKQLNSDIIMLQVGKVIDEEIVKDNQIEINKLRKDHEERMEQVNRQGPSGAAPPVIICAITRVCE